VFDQERTRAATTSVTALANALNVDSFGYMSRSNKQHRPMQIASRVEPELYEAIEALADQERRPISSLVRNILADRFKDQSQLEGAA
jgi:hypothetical protein